MFDYGRKAFNKNKTKYWIKYDIQYNDTILKNLNLEYNINVKKILYHFSDV